MVKNIDFLFIWALYKDPKHLTLNLNVKNIMSYHIYTGGKGHRSM